MSKKGFGSSGFGIATVEDDERRASKTLVWVTGLTLVLALLWAGWFELDEITRGQGKVIPSSREQVIQSMDTGVLSEMFVREGIVAFRWSRLRTTRVRLAAAWACLPSRRSSRA